MKFRPLACFSLALGLAGGACAAENVEGARAASRDAGDVAIDSGADVAQDRGDGAPAACPDLGPAVAACIVGPGVLQRGAEQQLALTVVASLDSTDGCFGSTAASVVPGVPRPPGGAGWALEDTAGSRIEIGFLLPSLTPDLLRAGDEVVVRSLPASSSGATSPRYIAVESEGKLVVLVAHAGMVAHAGLPDSAPFSVALGALECVGDPLGLEYHSMIVSGGGESVTLETSQTRRLLDLVVTNRFYTVPPPPGACADCFPEFVVAAVRAP